MRSNASDPAKRGAEQRFAKVSGSCLCVLLTCDRDHGGVPRLFGVALVTRRVYESWGRIFPTKMGLILDERSESVISVVCACCVFFSKMPTIEQASPSLISSPRRGVLNCTSNTPFSCSSASAMPPRRSLTTFAAASSSHDETPTSCWPLP